MGFESLDRVTIWILMIIGGLFAMVGLYLIVRRSADQNEAKIEIFGLKFQSSSAGTLVFLIGAGFLFTPLIVPEKPIETSLADTTSQSSYAQQANEVYPKHEDFNAPQDQVRGKLAVLLPAAAGATESEPNNSVTEANQITRGNVYAGRLDKARKDYEDWYVIPTKNVKDQDLRVQIRNLHGGCRVVVFNELEEELGNGYCNNNGGSVNIRFFNESGDYIFVKVGFNGGSSATSSSYELMVH